ncbi:unknown [Clostridium sp. CAG:288]|nr:unknown [Clostridium sp. CAG:288]
MRIHVSSNNNFISIYFYKINLIKIQQLFKYVNIDHVSILLDESNKYIFDNYILVDDFINHISNVNSSVLVFDGNVESCLTDKELDILMNKKILVDIDLGENMTYIIINKDNITITKEEIKKYLVNKLLSQAKLD